MARQVRSLQVGTGRRTHGRRSQVLARLLVSLGVLALGAALPILAAAHAPCTAQQSVSRALGEKTVQQLPAGPLTWRLESFATKAAAEAAAGQFGIPFEARGTFWLATVGPGGGASAGGTSVAQIGPVAAPSAASYRVRVQQRVSQPGCEGDIHTHPGAEAWYMLAGEQTVVTPAGETRIAEGQGLVGPPAGTPMQLVYRGGGESDALTFLLLDAAQPNSTPATFPPGLPNTGAGAPTPTTWWPVALLGLMSLTTIAASRRLARRRA